MGVDTTVVLPHRARIDDIAGVLGTLLGCPTTLKTFSGSGDGQWHYSSQTEGVTVKPFEHPGLTSCLRVEIESPNGPREFMFHWRMGIGEQIDGRRQRYEGCGFMAPSRPDSIALFVALADFFGGVVYFVDDWEEEGVYVQPEREDIGAFDGEAWTEFQRRKSEVKPLTREQIEKYREQAAYPEPAGYVR